MIDISIFEKIRSLKSKHADSDESAKKLIVEWEQRILQLSQTSDFIMLPAVQEIQKVLKGRIKDIMTKRCGKGHTPESLKILDEREAEIRYCLSLFSPQYEIELKSLEHLIDEELI